MTEETHNQTSASQAPSSGEIATQLARQRNELAVQRNYMACERTLMAWIRTTLAMISFGFTIAKLGQMLHDVEVRRLLGGVHVVGVRQLGDFLVVLGVAALLLAAVQYQIQVRELHATGARHRFSVAFTVALLLIVVGAFALTSLVISA